MLFRSEAKDDAKLFGLPYIFLRKPTPFDTTMLNYNWQLWNTKAFSVYGGQTNHVENKTSELTIDAILRFMKNIGIIKNTRINPGYNSETLEENTLVNVKAEKGGIFYRIKTANDKVSKGETLAHILDPYEGEIVSKVKSPVDGNIFFAHNKPLALEGSPLFKIIK